MFFGSKSIPGLARTMGRTMRQIKEASADIQSEIKKSSSEMKKDLNLEGLIRDTKEDIRRPLDQMADDLDNAVKYSPPKLNSHLEQSQIVKSTEKESMDLKKEEVIPNDTTSPNENKVVPTKEDITLDKKD